MTVAHPDAKKYDAVILDLLVDVSKSWDLSETEMVWLVDNATETILRSCIYETSSSENAEIWVCMLIFTVLIAIDFLCALPRYKLKRK